MVPVNCDHAFRDWSDHDWFPGGIKLLVTEMYFRRPNYYRVIDGGCATWVAAANGNKTLRNFGRQNRLASSGRTLAGATRHWNRRGCRAGAYCQWDTRPRCGRCSSSSCGCRGLRLDWIHQRFDLIACKGTAQVGHGPATFKNFSAVIVHVVQQKYPALESGKCLFHLLPIKFLPSSSCDSFQTFEDAGLVSLGLQTPDKPGPCVGQSFIVEVDWVLCNEYHAESKGATLFKQC